MVYENSNHNNNNKTSNNNTQVVWTLRENSSKGRRKRKDFPIQNLTSFLAHFHFIYDLAYFSMYSCTLNLRHQRTLWVSVLFRCYCISCVLYFTCRQNNFDFVAIFFLGCWFLQIIGFLNTLLGFKIRNSHLPMKTVIRSL